MSAARRSSGGGSAAVRVWLPAWIFTVRWRRGGADEFLDAPTAVSYPGGTGHGHSLRSRRTALLLLDKGNR
jgi:hypothetical protein